MNAYRPAFDMPTTPEQALAWVTRQGDPMVMTHSARHAAEAAKLLQARLAELELACAQAVEFATYVEEHAKGKMEEAARRFLSMEFAQDLEGVLKAGRAARAGGSECSQRTCCDCLGACKHGRAGAGAAKG